MPPTVFLGGFMSESAPPHATIAVEGLSGGTLGKSPRTDPYWFGAIGRGRLYLSSVPLCRDAHVDIAGQSAPM